MATPVVTSVASRSRIERAREWLDARTAGEEVVILGANPGAANELARGLTVANGAAFGWHCLSIADIAANIALPVRAARTLASITRLGSEAMVARLVHRLKTENGLGRFGPVGDAPGLPRAIAGVIAELRLARLSPDDLASVVPDLVPLLAAYETELVETGLTDWAGVLALATEAAASHRFAGLPMLMFDIAITSEAELTFISALAASSSELLATVPAADQPTVVRLRDELHWTVEDLDAQTLLRSPLQRLQRNLFSDVPTAETAETSGGVDVLSAPGEGRECIEIARRVLARAGEGIPFDRMAVFLRSPENYRANLEEAFGRAGIPVHFARGARRPDPAGRAFYALLRCALEGLSVRRFAEYLSLGQIPDAGVDGAPPQPALRGDRWVTPDHEAASEESDEPGAAILEAVDGVTDTGANAPVRSGQLRAPRRWEQLLIDAAVIGSRERWRRRLDGLAKELRVRLAELSEEEAEAAAITRMLDDLGAFTGYALPLIDTLDSWPSSATWGDWLEHLGELATCALRYPERVLAVLSELAPIAPVGPASLSEVSDVLEPLLLERAVPPPLQRYGKVFVGPVEAARGLSFDTVFVPGLAERMFPRKITEEPILLDAVREQLGDSLPTNTDRLENERLALALAVGAAENQICFSYPRLDLQDQPRPRVPSFYALEAFRASEGRLPDFSELARRAETASTARLGWPGPRNAAQAIDSAEYDLALLERLAAAGQSDVGAARYLINANPHLARALRARYQRWHASWTAADGLVRPSAAALAVLGRHAIAARSYSPTALQTYARCPYRFFLYAVHRLAPRVEPEQIDELDPLQRGSLIHEVQFELLARLRSQRLLPIRADRLKRAQHELDAVMTAVVDRYRDELAPAIERVWLDGTTAIGADLREWLRRSSLDDSGFVPRHFELSFGLETRPSERQADPRSLPDPVALDCGIRLRGSIDLVEEHRAGLMRVTDHKTGKFDGGDGQIIAGGTVLQPLLYALAAEKLFAGQFKVSAGRLYFCTARGGFEALEVGLDHEARAAAAQVANTIGDALERGFLPAYPGKDECGWCDYRSVCGPHEERRITRKPAAAVAPLAHLRDVP
jgi:ATP-dependent helicase/nuclease subunit B